MRATAQDPDAARLMGIDVDRTIALTFLLGGLLAGAAGMIYALYNGTVQFIQGFTAGLIAFTAAVMGGIGNLKGAVVGGLIIGVIQSISDTHYGQLWTPAVVFAMLILVMVFRPDGPVRRGDGGGDHRRGPVRTEPRGAGVCCRTGRGVSGLGRTSRSSTRTSRRSLLFRPGTCWTPRSRRWPT